MMNGDGVDELDVIRRLGDGIPDVDEPAKERARARLEGHIASLGVKGQHPSGRPRKRVLVAGLAAIVVGLFAVQAALPPGRGGPPTAAGTLRQLATVAAALQSQTIAEGELVYTKTERCEIRSESPIGASSGWSFSVNGEREIWVAPNGSGRILEHTGAPSFLSPADETAWHEAGSPQLLPEGSDTDEVFKSGGLSFIDFANLPDDATQLGILIQQRKVLDGPPGSTGTLSIVGDLLSETYAPPALRAALFQVASTIPGIESLGDVKDPTGRAGVGLAVTSDGLRTELVFDPATSDLLARLQVRVDESGAPIQDLGWIGYLDRGAVGSDSARP